GKSTLCAALMLSGWRLLSDELGLLDMKTRQIWGMARPLNLKNQSIDIIRQFAPSAEFSDPVPDTTKGLVALLKPGSDSVARRQQPAQVRWVVLPRYQPQAAPRLSRMDRAEAVMVMAEQSFNYHIHGEQGFDALVHLCRISECFKFEYSQLDEGVKAINAMAAAS
ncbi:MAG: HprK-related kinase A, partial [Paucibacter sp.]|nr:HprK-related kinase A [Roseateles sp.]